MWRPGEKRHNIDIVGTAPLCLLDVLEKTAIEPLNPVDAERQQLPPVGKKTGKDALSFAGCSKP